MISSLPSLVSRAMHSNSSMWIEVKTSSLMIRSEIEDRVLEVVALPRHERDDHVLAERELTDLGRRTVGDDVALLHPIALADDGLLVDARVLVRAQVLEQVVDIDLGPMSSTTAGMSALTTMRRGVDLLDDAVTLRDAR